MENNGETPNNMMADWKPSNQVWTPKWSFDAKLIAKNGAEINVNKAILGGVCRYFSRYGDQKEPILEIKMINSDQLSRKLLELIVKFPYTGRVNLHKSLDSRNFANELLTFYSLSKEIDYTQLTNVIEKELHTLLITLENVATVFEVASKYGLQWLREKCTQFVDDKSEEIIEMVKRSDDSFPESQQNKEIIGKFSVDLIMEIVKSDTFFVSNELEMFELIYLWGELSGNETVVAEALKNLRIELMNPKEFNSILQKTKLIKPTDYFDAMEHCNRKQRQKRKLAENASVVCHTKSFNSIIKKISLRSLSSECKSSISSSISNASLVDRSLQTLCDGQSGDIALTDGHEYRFYAHSSVLLASCRFFEQLLKDVATPENVEEIRDLSEFDENSINVFLKYINGEPISLETMNEEAVIDLFELTKKIEFEKLNNIVANFLNRAEANVSNIIQLYNVATENSLTPLLETCHRFFDNNASKLLSKKEVLTKLPIALLERVVSQKMDKEAFQALKEYSDLNPGIDLMSILKRLPLENVSMEEYITNILPTGLVSEKFFIEAHKHKTKAIHFNIINAGCKSHPLTVCKPSVTRKWVKSFRDLRSSPVTCDYNCVTLNVGDTLTVELDEEHTLNYVKFRLYDEALRMYNYEVRTSVSQKVSDQGLVKSTVGGCSFASLQEIVFKPRNVKFIYITAVDGPLKMYSKSIEAMLRPDLDSEAYFNGRQFCGGRNIIADLSVDDEAKRIYPLFNDNDDEVVYMLRYPFESSSLEISFNSALTSKVELWTKESLSEVWVQRASIEGVDVSLPTAVFFQKSLVSFFKVTGLKIRNKIKHIQCPATFFNQ